MAFLCAVSLWTILFLAINKCGFLHNAQTKVMLSACRSAWNSHTCCFPLHPTTAPWAKAAKRKVEGQNRWKRKWTFGNIYLNCLSVYWPWTQSSICPLQSTGVVASNYIYIRRGEGTWRLFCSIPVFMTSKDDATPLNQKIRASNGHIIIFINEWGTSLFIDQWHQNFYHTGCEAGW